jgi:histidine phosphotransferase ChpT
MINDIEISELIAVKMCHDLSGPVGAVNNGTELLKEANEAIYEQSLDLVEGSAKDLVARVLLYRQAFGSINSTGQVSVENLEKLTADYYNSGKVDVVFSGDNKPDSVDSYYGKMILNLIMMIEKNLLYGGKIDISIEKKNNKEVSNIKVEGRSIKVNEEHLEILDNKDSKIKIDVKNVQSYLVRRFLEKLDMKIKFSIKEEVMEIKIS